jgi:hypothetical protein
MPIEFNDLDVVSKVTGLSSALIVPCNMCPAVSVAVRENKPFIQFFKSFLKSAPFEQYIRALGPRADARSCRNVLDNMKLSLFWAANRQPKQYARWSNRPIARCWKVWKLPAL